MAEFLNERLGVRFTIADRPSDEAMLRYFESCARIQVDPSHKAQLFFDFWPVVLPLIRFWECAAIPDPAKLDFDAAADPRATAIVTWVEATVAEHMGRVKADAEDLARAALSGRAGSRAKKMVAEGAWLYSRKRVN